MVKSLNELTPDILHQVETMAGLFYTESQTAVALEIDEKFFTWCMMKKENALYRAFTKGWVQADYELRESIKTLALSGSGPAQEQMLNILKKAKANRTKA